MSTVLQDLADRGWRYRRSSRQVLEAVLTQGTDIVETALVAPEHDRFPNLALRSRRRGVRVAFIYPAPSG